MTWNGVKRRKKAKHHGPTDRRTEWVVESLHATKNVREGRTDMARCRVVCQRLKTSQQWAPVVSEVAKLHMGCNGLLEHKDSFLLQATKWQHRRWHDCLRQFQMWLRQPVRKAVETKTCHSNKWVNRRLRSSILKEIEDVFSRAFASVPLNVLFSFSPLFALTPQFFSIKLKFQFEVVKLYT